MSKKINFIIILIIVLVNCKISGQSNFHFADSTAQWQYLVTEYTMFPPIIINKFTLGYVLAGDSIVLTTPYQVIESGNHKILVRQDSSKRVYRLGYQFQEHLLFDFSLETGDKFWVDQLSYLRVDSIDTMDWSGGKKRMYLSCPAGGCNYENEIWLEGVGFLNLTWSFQPFSRDLLFDGPSYELLCYAQSDSVRYTNPEYQVCSFDTTIYLSVKDFKRESVAIYPNPAGNEFKVSGLEFKVGEKYVLTLYDVLGRNVLMCELADKSISINVGALKSGIYFYAIQSNQGMVQQGKLVKQ